jgi:hypothetical protein
MTPEQWKKLIDIIEDPNKSGFQYFDETVITRDCVYKGAWIMKLRTDPPVMKIFWETFKEGSTGKDSAF